MVIKMTRVDYPLAYFLYVLDQRRRLLLKLTVSRENFKITFKIYRVL